MAGADAVIDLSNSPVWEDDAVREFFTTSTGNLLAAERDAGVRHHPPALDRAGELTPGDGARIGTIDFDTWLVTQGQGAAR